MTEITKSWRHLFSAVLTLGTSEGSVYERLRAAYRGPLTQLVPHSGLPDRVRGDFEELMTELADLLNQPDGTDSYRASHLAKRVVALYDSVAKELK